MSSEVKKHPSGDLTKPCDLDVSPQDEKPWTQNSVEIYVTNAARNKNILNENNTSCRFLFSWTISDCIRSHSYELYSQGVFLEE